MPLRPALVVLAAGLGQRFGGLKQLAPVGPAGEAILDYSVADATAAGFAPVVLLVRSEIEAAMGSHVRAAWPANIDVRLVCQDVDPVAQAAAAAGRAKPLGTAHAVLAAVRGAGLDGPFAVINADDLYGADAYGLLADLVSTVGVGFEGALVAFEAAQTVQGDGPFTRALCQVDAAGGLSAIEEGAIQRRPDGCLVWTGRSGRRVELAGDEPVSMNFWGFPSEIAEALDGAVADFVGSGLAASGEEVLLPEVVRTWVEEGRRVAVLRSEAPCLGLTYAGDVAVVAAALGKPSW